MNHDDIVEGMVWVVGKHPLSRSNGISCLNCRRFEGYDDIPNNTNKIVYCNFNSHNKMFMVNMEDPACGEYVGFDEEEVVIVDWKEANK